MILIQNNDSDVFCFFLNLRNNDFYHSKITWDWQMDEQKQVDTIIVML